MKVPTSCRKFMRDASILQDTNDPADLSLMFSKHSPLSRMLVNDVITRHTGVIRESVLVLDKTDLRYVSSIRTPVTSIQGDPRSNTSTQPCTATLEKNLLPIEPVLHSVHPLLAYFFTFRLLKFSFCNIQEYWQRPFKHRNGGVH